MKIIRKIPPIPPFSKGGNSSSHISPFVKGENNSSLIPPFVKGESNSSLIPPFAKGRLGGIYIIIAIGLTLPGCSSYKPLQAPCTYNHRNGCGPMIPMTPPPVLTPQANHS